MIKPWMKYFYKFHNVATTGEEGGGGGDGQDHDLTDDNMDWLFAEDSDEEDPEPEPESESEEEPEAEPEPEPEPEPTPEEDPAPEPEPTPEPELEVEQPDVAEPTAEEVAQKRQEFLAEIEKEFAISEEDANLILSEPESVLPRMAAQIYDRAMRDSAQMIQNAMQNVPQMMTQVSEQQVSAQAAQTKFIELNPQLSGLEQKELDGLVESYAPLVAKQMPNATPEEKMQALGRTIAAAKNLGTAPVAKPKEQPLQPHTPAAPVRSGGEHGKPSPATPDEAFIDMLIDNQDD